MEKKETTLESWWRRVKKNFTGDFISGHRPRFRWINKVSSSAFCWLFLSLPYLDYSIDKKTNHFHIHFHFHFPFQSTFISISISLFNLISVSITLFIFISISIPFPFSFPFPLNFHFHFHFHFFLFPFLSPISTPILKIHEGNVLLCHYCNGQRPVARYNRTRM